jgi:Domain of unknown function (DUF222)/HNH endonuclease
MITAVQVDAEQELAALCGEVNASYARLVAIVGGCLVDDSWAIAGIRSPEHWLSMRAGLSHFHARQVLAVARRHGELPEVMAQFASGQLSLDQVAVIARYAPAHVEASVAEFAVNASVSQLRRALSRYSFDPPTEPGHEQGTTTSPNHDHDPDNPTTTPADHSDSDPDHSDSDGDHGDHGDHEPCTATCSATCSTTEPGDPACSTTTCSAVEPSDPASASTLDPASVANPATWNGLALIPDRASAPPELTMGYDQWGRFTLRFSAPADQGALVEAALKEAKDALFHADRPQATWGEAMIELATRSLATITSINRRDAYRTYIHLDTEGAWLTGKPRLPQQLTRKLTCDGILQPVWHTQGAPVNVGRAQRIVPTRTRRLVEDRDRGCRYPGCPATTHVECHHVIHWIDGGPTDTWNLASLCPYHHDGHHNRDYTITGNADHPNGLTYTTRHGNPITPGPTFTTPPPPKPPPSTPSTAGTPGSPGTPSEPDPPDSASSTNAPEAPDSPCSPAPTPAPAPAQIYYRGPTGESLDLGWVTFREPPNPAYYS